MNPLEQRQFAPVRDALVSGYGSWQSWVELVAVSLDMDLQRDVAPGAINTVAWSVLQLTEQYGTTEILLREAVSRRPRNPALRAMAREFGLAPAPFTNVVVAKPSVGVLSGDSGEVVASQLSLDEALQYEAIARPREGFAKTGAWRREMASHEYAVCQILYDNDAIGTGFLIGPDLIMSNHHVFAKPDTDELLPLKHFAARFDYRATEGEAQAAASGTTTPTDAGAGYLDASPREQLDYVIVKLAAARGEDPMPGGGKRGWLRPDSDPFQDRDVVVVLQHPAARSLEMAVGQIVGWDKGREREIHVHLANTQQGSSGSPCFSWRWALRALHHRGQAGDVNRAVSLAAILERMGAEGTIGLLPQI